MRPFEIGAYAAEIAKSGKQAEEASDKVEAERR